MEDVNKDEYIYLLAVNTLGLDKTILTYDVTPFKTLDDVNDAVLDSITNMAKANRGEIYYIKYRPRNNIDISENSHTPCGKVVFKSTVEVMYNVLRRKIK